MERPPTATEESGEPARPSVRSEVDFDADGFASDLSGWGAELDVVVFGPLGDNSSQGLGGSGLVECLDGGGDLVDREGLACGPVVPGVEGLDAVFDLLEVLRGEFVALEEIVTVEGVACLTETSRRIGTLPVRFAGDAVDLMEVVLGAFDGVVGDAEFGTGGASAEES